MHIVVRLTDNTILAELTDNAHVTNIKLYKNS